MAKKLKTETFVLQGNEGDGKFTVVAADLDAARALLAEHLGVEETEISEQYDAYKSVATPVAGVSELCPVEE